MASERKVDLDIRPRRTEFRESVEREPRETPYLPDMDTDSSGDSDGKGGNESGGDQKEKKK